MDVSDDHVPIALKQETILDMTKGSRIVFWRNYFSGGSGIGHFLTNLRLYSVFLSVSEYAYGGHPFPFSGIFEIAPRDAEDLGEHFKYKYVFPFRKIHSLGSVIETDRVTRCLCASSR